MKRRHYLVSVFSMILLVVALSSCKKKKGIPELTTKDVTSISSQSAISGGNITNDNGYLVTERGVCWSLLDNPTINDSKTSDGAGSGSFISVLNGLSPNKKYYLRAYATTSKGTGYGSIVVFETTGNQITDSRDGNVYSTIVIGNQTWMSENLRYLPQVSPINSGNHTSPHYYVYNNNYSNVADAKATENFQTYGVLYNWVAATTACPSGWHLPSDAEWNQLESFLGANVGGKLKSTMHWNSPNQGATNESGFSAFPGGARYNNGSNANLKSQGFWWASNPTDESNASSRQLKHDSSVFYSGIGHKGNGISVRCIKD